MIGFPTFKECRETATLGGRSTCMACHQPVDAVALVGIVERPWLPVGPAAIGKFGPDTAFIAVGPCGHTTLDADENGYVYRWDAE